MRLRPARPTELDEIRDIEARAAAAFADTAHAALAVPGPEDLRSIEALESARRRGGLLVAEQDGVLVGFALSGALGDDAHLEELDVVPEAAGAGIGGALVEAVCEHARRDGHARIVLTTFSDVPFNAPFYARRGFRVLDAAERSAELDAILAAEAAAGLDPAARCAMARQLARAPARASKPCEPTTPRRDA